MYNQLQNGKYKRIGICIKKQLQIIFHFLFVLANRGVQLANIEEKHQHFQDVVHSDQTNLNDRYGGIKNVTKLHKKRE